MRAFTQASIDPHPWKKERTVGKTKIEALAPGFQRGPWLPARKALRKGFRLDHATIRIVSARKALRKDRLQYEEEKPSR
jgi:hypothetical protein